MLAVVAGLVVILRVRFLTCFVVVARYAGIANDCLVQMMLWIWLRE